MWKEWMALCNLIRLVMVITEVLNICASRGVV